MVWSQLSVKIFGVHFGNCVLNNSNWDKITHSLTKKSIFQTECYSLWDEKKKQETKERIVNRIFYSKLWYKGQIYNIPNFIVKEVDKENSSILHLEV